MNPAPWPTLREVLTVGVLIVLVQALTACGPSTPNEVCEPVTHDLWCVESYRHYSVCCDPHYTVCAIQLGYQDPTDTGYLPEAPQACGTYAECIEHLGDIEAACDLRTP